MPLQISLADYGIDSLNNLAHIAGSMNGEVKPGAGIRDRAMIGDVGLNRTKYDAGTFGANGAAGTSGAAKFLSDPNQFSTWLTSEGAAYKNATGMRDAVLAVGKNPAAFDSLSPQMQQNMLASLAATRGVYGTGELRGISGGSTMYSVTSILSAGRSAEHQRYGSDLGVNVGGNTFYGHNRDMSAGVAQGINNYDFDTAISTAANNLPQNVAAAYRAYQPNLFKAVGLGFADTTPLNPGSDRDGPGDYFGIGGGNIGDSGRPVETGGGTGFTGIDASGNVGPGSNNLGGAIPLGPAPGPYDFANGGTPGGIGDGNFGFGITPGGPSAPAPGPYDFANGSTGGSSANGSFGFGITPNGGGGGLPSTPAPTLPPPPGTSTINSMYEAILRRPGDAAGLQAFDAQLDSGKMDLNQIQAMLRGSEEAKTLGPLGEARTYSPLETVFARQLDRAPDAQAIQNWGTAQNIDPVEAFVYGSPEAQTYRAGLGDTASLIRNPSTAPTIGPGGTAGTVGPGATTAPLAPFGFSGTFSPSEYLKANSDVAASGMDALTHYATYGYNEGRSVDTAGHRVNQGFDANAYLAGNQDVAKAGLDPLEHYVQYGAAEGRSLPTGSTAPYQFSGANVSQGAGNGSFSGTFDGAAYLKQNGDVAAAGMNPLDHYLRYGFAEGRAIDTGGTTINQGFDPSAYLQQNRDVADAKLDPLAHYVTYGAHEGRAAPTGSNPYSFSNFNVAQGAGSLGNGTFGFGGATSGSTGGGSSPSGSSIPSFGFGQNVSQNVGAGSFGTGITPSPAPSISSFGFSGANVSGGLGATNQGLGGSYAVGSAADLGFGSSGGGGGSGGDGTIDPYGFGGDVSGFDVNNLGGSAVQESAGASGFGDGAAIQGRNNQASQNAFIAGEFKKAADSTAAARQLGEQITNVAPGNQTNYALGAINPTPTPQIQHTQFTPVNMSGVFAPLPTAPFMPRFAG